MEPQPEQPHHDPEYRSALAAIDFTDFDGSNAATFAGTGTMMNGTANSTTVARASRTASYRGRPRPKLSPPIPGDDEGQAGEHRRMRPDRRWPCGIDSHLVPSWGNRWARERFSPAIVSGVLEGTFIPTGGSSSQVAGSTVR